MSRPEKTVLQLRGRRLAIEPGRPLLMGVVNASPESFFDGARHQGVGAQLAQARSLDRDGAALVDVGGQSGVTHRSAVPTAEELRRVLPLVERLAAEGLAVSVDTWDPVVARRAVEVGAAMVNDVSGLSDPAIAEACADSGAALVITHTGAAPKRKAFPRYRDVGAAVVRFLERRIEVARAHGVHDVQIVLDPGPDLGKTPAQTVAVLAALGRVRELGRPVLLAVSRKDFVGALTGRPPAERLGGTLAAVGEGVDAGAAIVRTHDVAATADFLTVRAALRGERETPAEPLDRRLRREESAA